jgi:hypothetical protein
VYGRTPVFDRKFLQTVHIGTAVYLPLCWYEIRMSPQLHYMIYGFQQHVFAQTRRFGGWRPMVFLQHGIALGMWMCATAITCYALWSLRAKFAMFRLGLGFWLLAFAVSLVACKSMGAIVLFVVGVALFVSARWFRSTSPIVVLALMAPMFLLARIALGWSPEFLIELATDVSEDRASSLQVRIAADTALLERALEQPLFGWGRWDRFRGDVKFTDSLWGIAVGQHGLIGLTSLFGALALAPLAALRAMRASRQTKAPYPELLALCVSIGLYALDCLVNAHLCSVFFAGLGVLAAWGGAPGDEGGTPLRAPHSTPPSA